MPDYCPHCGGTDLRYYHAIGATETDPYEPAGWECQTCGAFITEAKPDEATRLGI